MNGTSRRADICLAVDRPGRHDARQHEAGQHDARHDVAHRRQVGPGGVVGNPRECSAARPRVAANPVGAEAPSVRGRMEGDVDPTSPSTRRSVTELEAKMW
jgi:hypothetical protein